MRVGSLTNVEELLEYSYKYNHGRALTYMEINLKLLNIKSHGSIYKELVSLVKHGIIKKIYVKVNGVVIPFYYKKCR